MIFLSSAPAVDFTAKIVLNILSKFFIAFAWSSAVYVNITLICSLYSEYFHIIFAMVQSTALCGFACGYYITKYSDLHQVYIGFAVCSMILLLILYQLMGDVNYILSSERYTVVDYLRKPKQLVSFSYLIIILFGEACLVYFAEICLKEYTSNKNLVFIYSLFEIFGGLIGLLASTIVNIKQAKALTILIIGILYAFTYILIGPWSRILPHALWISIIGMIFNGILSSLLIVNLVLNLYHNGITHYNYTAEELLSECIGSLYILAFSIACLTAPIFSVSFSKFITPDHIFALVSLITIAISIIHAKICKETSNDLHVVNTSHSDMPQIRVIQNKSDESNHVNEKSEEGPLELLTFKKDSSEAYDYNYIGIQAGYFVGESNPERFEKSSSLSYHNKTMPVKMMSDITDTIEEQKIEESIGEIPVEDLPETENQYRIRTMPPVFKEKHLEPESPPESIENPPAALVSSSSNEVINELNELFPSNISN